MRAKTIPGWTSSGVLPSINPASPTSMDRSPYQVGIFDFALRFGTSSDRNRILLGLLEYRQVLRELGIARGFQWVDGSFLEDVERLEGRAPNDLDVVTFAHLPSGITQRDLIARRPNLFDRNRCKQDYRVDGFLVQLNGAPPEYLVERSRYWYSLWSHRRSGVWKGYIELSLDADDDRAARQNVQPDTLEEDADL
ncbi:MULTISPECIES: DUF6932 family protein [unclassified Thiocapsa]|uniref:DUF6932 family protein n=1 Tax=unclassified Thiocapsa TaxID=2641286 RepID=UPI0035B1EBAC